MAKQKKLATYADLITHLLAEKGWTAYRLAKEAGLTNQAVLDLSHGKREPKADTLRLILRAAGKPWAWLDEHFQPDS